MSDPDQLFPLEAQQEGPTFHRCLKAVHLTVALASQAHTTWLTVGYFVTRNDNRFPVTSYLLRSSFLTMIVELYKALDTREDVYSLRSLLRLAQREEIPHIDAEDCNAMIAEMEPLWRKVRLLRHKAYARLDSERTIASLLLETGNNAEDFERLLKLYEKCLTHLHKCIAVRFPPLAEADRLIKDELTTAIRAICDKAGYRYF
jgi:hypothetical protein